MNGEPMENAENQTSDDTENPAILLTAGVLGLGILAGIALNQANRHGNIIHWAVPVGLGVIVEVSAYHLNFLTRPGGDNPGRLRQALQMTALQTAGAIATTALVGGGSAAAVTFIATIAEARHLHRIVRAAWKGIERHFSA